MNDIAQRIADLSPEKRKQLLQKLKRTKGDAGAQKMVRQPRDTNTFTLSFAQQRLWFLDQLEPGTFTWNIPLVIRINGELNVKAFRQAILALVERHEVLRTTFATANGEPVQVIGTEGKVTLPVIDLSNLSAAERTPEFKRLALQDAQRPFDLAKGPLMRTTLLRLGEREYIFLLTVHHIGSDAWSMGVFFKELAVFYKVFVSGAPSPLTELSIQYADFSAWQRQWLQGEELQTQLAFWKKHLTGAPPVLELPLDRPRPAVQTFPGDVEYFKSPKNLLDALQKLGRECNATLFMTLLAAFKVLLFRYTGQEDIVVGSPIAGRNRAETEALIGFFINNLVLRTQMHGSPNFRELLTRVRQVSLGAFGHQDLPFEKLVEELQPERNLSTPPLFQVMFILQNAPMDEVDFAGLTLSPVAFNNYKTSRFDISIYMGEDDNGQLIGAFEYNTDLFQKATIKRMVGHFETLLEGIVANPNQPISELPFLMESEKCLILEEWNDTTRDYPQDRCFHQAFEAQAEKTPDAVATIFDGQNITYGELNARANQLSHRLKKMNVSADNLVGICVERSIEMMIGLLGIMKAGGAYVPVDPAYPRDRVAFMLEDAGISVLLTQKKLVDSLPEHAASVLCLDDWQSISTESTDNPGTVISSDSLAYVIYTSGSTGKPKGVAIRHGNLVNFLYSMAETPGFTEKDILLAVTTLSFDIAGLELYLPLITGGCVVLTSREVASDGRRLSKEMEKYGATIMQATPATWRMLLDSDWQGNPKLKMLCGGEAMPRELANRLVEKGASLWNMYGPTETTIWSAAQEIVAGDGLVSIGSAIANTQLYIVDGNLRPVPVGVHGELLIGGDGLARGYLYRADLTAEKFIPDPFSKKPGARLYRTGDLTRFLPDGNIEYISRIDHQVKIRGFRIELGEIESVLSSHAGVDKAAVIVREDNPGDKRLVAYIISENKETPKASSLRSHLQEKLPEYMVPSAFVFLDKLPLTPNGKLDRKALPAPDAGGIELQTEYKPPHNEAERIIAAVWKDVLHVDKVGVNDNFFDLGGHSLLLVQVQNKLCDKLQRELSIIELFKYPTVKSLAQFFNPGSKPDKSMDKLQDIAKRQKQALAKQKRHTGNIKKEGQPA